MKFQFDYRIEDLSGVYRCETCNSRFYDENTPSHLEDCSAVNNGDKNIVYRYGPKEAREVLLKGASSYSRLKISDLSVEARRSVDVVGVECMCG